ncbi:putative sulfate exporter family transporter [uncultured Ramlibacter sp.]|mgnify:CR=1 FL=1|uniref:YeiH family protein n=1 Tax=uncultured Ramlibacter sp. TaxID=260755 RepID=UPI00260AC0B7|nr:putative sulfate exporter family transporter [uncultured Ramlibacter sp.]
MLAALPLPAWAGQLRLLAPGLLASAVVATAATFLSQHYGAPVMLFALLLGMAMAFLSTDGPCRPGIEFAARQVLRVGIALLGLRITLAQVVALGWGPLGLVLLSVVLTIAVSIVAARAMGFQRLFGLLTGGATAICGASAALALSAALPAHPQKDRATLFTVIGVSALSTLAMVAYPMLVRALDLDERTAGLFLGVTIHDVAQVVGAGYSLSTETGDTATLVKLLRVAMLLPVIVLATVFTRQAGAAGGGERPPLLPWFAVAFALLVGVNSTGWLPVSLASTGTDVSRWCLVVAIAAIGMKTHLKELVTVGIKPVVLMVGETVFLALLALLLLRWLG